MTGCSHSSSVGAATRDAEEPWQVDEATERREPASTTSGIHMIGGDSCGLITVGAVGLDGSSPSTSGLGLVACLVHRASPKKTMIT